jgi:putative transposase
MICIVVIRAFKYRLTPTKEQSILLEKHFGCTRFIWNWALNKKMKTYQITKKNVSRYELQAELPKMKKGEQPWLAEVGSLSIQSKLEDLDKAYTSFFRHKNAYPNFKSKKNRQCFRVPQNTKVEFEKSKVIIPKFLEGIKCIYDRQFDGMVSSSYVSKTTTGKYFISILVDDGKELPTKPKIAEKSTIGIDLGLKHFATLSNGTKIENPKPLKRFLKKLKKQQRQLSKKIKGSNNRNRQRIKVAKTHEKITNCRKDFHHKLSHKLTHDNQVKTICMETLSTKDMMKNKDVDERDEYRFLEKMRHQQISDVGWNSFTNILKYKCDWYGKNFIQIGRYEPSSKLCSCGYINHSLTLKDREWTCPACKITHDRDILAANNIKFIGLEQPESKASGLEKSGMKEETARSLA